MGGVSEPITVFLLDNYEIVRRGLRDPLESEGDMSVIGAASTRDQAVGRVHALDPDVVAVGGIRNPDPPDVDVDRVVVVARDPMGAAQNRAAY